MDDSPWGCIESDMTEKLSLSLWQMASGAQSRKVGTQGTMKAKDWTRWAGRALLIFGFPYPPVWATLKSVKPPSCLWQ